ncbi:adenine phosphoribosyltransferase [Tessaracoccus lapidicaptus]|uniref:Adenine phosphoribosyltransferase n=1 Tax=Tessaracoccus lapidicaptus TaxID=1427523 RepID=A0A1C0AMX6_9ACTN|nr:MULTISPECIES: adenine phosphoribosyltransferase [Tessaracoccus]AQX14663.1 adenine phosphoribosyltransferase [Tessaracoccus sp. T2.5-30]OCL34677.1 adenine phosphoribosyltransferase [Tessaracoccus lapidicaptus]VEP38724.1 Adenine phosphoribosyltransferase [Tessaracoccus lapidicaptus]
MTDRQQLIAGLIADVPDFPRPGVMFKDITPLLASPAGFEAAVTALVEAAPRDIDVVVGMEARGFIFAAPVALALGAGFVPVRKPGKLPGETISESFELEYGFETLTVHRDAIRPGARVLVIDDVLATGGTVGATAALLRQMGAELVHVAVLMELSFLEGRARLAELGVDNVTAVLTV